MTRSVMQLICDIYNLIFMCDINFGRGVLLIISIEHYLFNQRTEPSQVNLTIVYVQKHREASKGDDKKFQKYATIPRLTLPFKSRN